MRDGEIAKAAAFIRPKGWDDMPAGSRAGPSIAPPIGRRQGLDGARLGIDRAKFRQPLKNEITQTQLKELKLPTLLIAGAAGMSTPPSSAHDRGGNCRHRVAFIPVRAFQLLEQPGCSIARCSITLVQ